MIGFAASALLPARAGEVLRPWLLARKEGLSATAAFATIILERVLDTVMVLLLFGLFLLLADPDFARGDPVAFSRLKLGGAVAGAVSVVALAVMFFLAGHPRDAGSDRRRCSTRVLPARLAARATRFLRTFAERARHRAAAGPARGGAGAVGARSGCRLRPASGWCRAPSTSTCRSSGSFLVMALLVVGVAVPTPGGGRRVPLLLPAGGDRVLRARRTIGR